MSEPTGLAQRERILHWAGSPLPAGMAAFAAAARDESDYFLIRFAAEWTSGVLRFDGPGECLFLADVGGRLVGVSGIGHRRAPSPCVS